MAITACGFESYFPCQVFLEHISESIKVIVPKCLIMIGDKTKIAKCKKRHFVWLIAPFVSFFCLKHTSRSI